MIFKSINYKEVRQLEILSNRLWKGEEGWCLPKKLQIKQWRWNILPLIDSPLIFKRKILPQTEYQTQKILHHRDSSIRTGKRGILPVLVLDGVMICKLAWNARGPGFDPIQVKMIFLKYNGSNSWNEITLN